MESKKKEIAKFYGQIFSDAKLRTKIEEKAKKIASEEDLRKLLNEDIMPLMKKYNVDFSEEELLEFEEESLRELSKKDLSNVSGGVSLKSAVLGGGILSMALLGGVSLNANAMQLPVTQNGNAAETQNLNYTQFRLWFNNVGSQARHILEFLGENKTEDICSLLEKLDDKSRQALKSDLLHILKQIEEGVYGLQFKGRFLSDNRFTNEEFKAIFDLAINLGEILEKDAGTKDMMELAFDWKNVLEKETQEEPNNIDEREDVEYQEEQNNMDESTDGAEVDVSSTSIAPEISEAPTLNVQEIQTQNQEQNSVQPKAQINVENQTEAEFKSEQENVPVEQNNIEGQNQLEAEFPQGDVPLETNQGSKQPSQEGAGPSSNDVTLQKPKKYKRSINGRNGGGLFNVIHNPRNNAKNQSGKKNKAKTSNLTNQPPQEEAFLENISVENSEVTIPTISVQKSQMATQGLNPVQQEAQINVEDQTKAAVEPAQGNVSLEAHIEKNTNQDSNQPSQKVDISPAYVPTEASQEATQNVQESKFQDQEQLEKEVKIKQPNNHHRGKFRRDTKRTLLKKPKSKTQLDQHNDTVASNLTKQTPQDEATRANTAIENSEVTTPTISVQENQLQAQEPISAQQEVQSNTETPATPEKAPAASIATSNPPPLAEQTQTNATSNPKPSAEQTQTNATSNPQPSAEQTQTDATSNPQPLAEQTQTDATSNPQPLAEQTQTNATSNPQPLAEQTQTNATSAHQQQSSTTGESNAASAKIVKEENIDGLNFKLDENGTLTISGAGPLSRIWRSSFDKNPVKSVVLVGVTSIGNNAFSYRGDLQTITIPSSVTSIGDKAFLGCISLRNITIPSSVTSIGNTAFRDCHSLQDVTILYGVTSIGREAFSGCSSLQNVTIPSSVTSIGNYAFSGCSSLQTITIPSSVTSIGDQAFAICSSLRTITIPSSVTSIGDQAFSGCSTLQNITIPSSVTSIGRETFADCSSLQTITIPSSVTSIGRETFANCSTLQDVTILSGVTSIEWETFVNCSSLQTITIPSSVTSIGKRAFLNCSSLQNVTILSGVTSIENDAFEYCHKLKSINVDENNEHYKSIGGVLFSKDGNTLTLVLYPEGKDDEESYEIPSGVTSIENHASYGGKSLQSITIPSSVTSIGDSFFGFYPKLKSINVDENNEHYKSIGGVLFSKDGKTLLRYPEGKDGESYEISSSVTSIGDSAFSGCSSLQTITIPSSVTSIGKFAFVGCSNQLTVKYLGTEEPVIPLEGLFNDDQIVSIHVPFFYETFTFGKKDVIADIHQNFKDVINEFGASNKNGESNASSANGARKATIGDLNFTLDENGTLTISGTKILSSISKDWKRCFDTDKVKSVVLDGVDSIEDEAFSDCKNLQSITLGKVTSIGYQAFRHCSSLRRIAIPERVTEINALAFGYCGSLRRIILPSTMSYIADNAFLDCYSLRQVMYLGEKDIAANTGNLIPDEERDVFSSSEQKIKIIVPYSYTGGDKFSTREVTRAAKNKKRQSGPVKVMERKNLKDGNQYQCTRELHSNGVLKFIVKDSCALPPNCMEKYRTNRNIDTVVLDRIPVIGESSFENCVYLQKIVIPDSVKNIQRKAFLRCTNLANITIPSSVTNIGPEAFRYCKRLKTVIYLGTNPIVEQSVFLNCPKDLIIKVPPNYEGEMFCGIRVQKMTPEEFEELNPTS